MDEFQSAIPQGPGPRPSAGGRLKGQGGIEANRIQARFRPGIALAATFAVDKEHAPRRQVLDSAVGDKLSYEGPAGASGTVYRRHQFGPMPAAVVPQLRYADRDQDLVHSTTLLATSAGVEWVPLGTAGS